jgi:uncharacterized RDD family membrane protein YckC
MSDHPAILSQRVLTFRTPENIELSFALAGPGSRAAAYLIDVAIMLAVGQMLINLIAFALASLVSAFGGEGAMWVAAISALGSFTLYNGYFILLEWLLNGQTAGKRLLHIRVIKQGGYSLRFFDTLLRNLLRVVDFLPLFYGVGLTSLLLTRDSQRLGDLVAGTLVVYQEPVEAGAMLPEMPPAEESESPFTPAALAAVPDSLIDLAGQYLIARGELAPRPRQEVAAELVELIRATSGLEPRPTQSIDSFLASLIRRAEPAPPWTSRSPAGAELSSS